MHRLGHLARLQAQSIHIMGETVAECRRPAMWHSAMLSSVTSSAEILSAPLVARAPESEASMEKKKREGYL